MSKYILLFFTIGLLLSCNNQPAPTPTTTTKSQDQAAKPLQAKKTILFFGNSLTAGMGLDEEEAFPALIQQKIDAKKLAYNVINGGLSGETTAGGLSRVDWMLKQKIDIFVLELGGNDGLRGVDPKSSKQNLQGIIDKVRDKYPDCTIVLAGMEAPPNMGKEFTSQFRNMYKDLARKNNLPLIPFLLENVAGEKDLNLPDGIHPNVAGQKIVAENVWKTLEQVIEAG